MTRPQLGKYPPLKRLCVDYAGLVWAVPEKYPDVPALDIGYVRRTRGRWAYETTEHGLSRQTFADPLAAADALLALAAGIDQGDK